MGSGSGSAANLRIYALELISQRSDFRQLFSSLPVAIFFSFLRPLLSFPGQTPSALYVMPVPLPQYGFDKCFRALKKKGGQAFPLALRKILARECIRQSLGDT